MFQDHRSGDNARGIHDQTGSDNASEFDEVPPSQSVERPSVQGRSRQMRLTQPLLQVNGRSASNVS